MTTDIDVLHPRTATEAVAARLRAEIQTGRQAPGTPLRQNDVAKRFGVSTTPVREAFALLAADGLVRIDRYRGAVVFMPTQDDLRGAYEIREALETLAIEKATPKLTEEKLDQLEDVLREMRATGDVERWMELNEQFHVGLYEAAGNERLSALIVSQRDACSMYIRMHVSHELQRDEMDQQHAEILAACRRRDVVRAREAARLHLEASMRQILRIIGELETEARAREADAASA
jgi:DNA-binding GntR family transcriptional regulator